MKQRALHTHTHKLYNKIAAKDIVNGPEGEQNKNVIT